MCMYIKSRTDIVYCNIVITTYHHQPVHFTKFPPNKIQLEAQAMTEKHAKNVCDEL